MAQSLTKDQIAELKEVFRMMDKNSDGFITSTDIMGLIRFLNENPTNEEVQEMMSELVDANGDETINFEEFLNVMSRKMKDNASEELKEAFKVFDRDQDGYISPNEARTAVGPLRRSLFSHHTATSASSPFTPLRHVMIHLGERLNDEELEQMITEADLDGDGVISYEEFVRVMMSTV